MYECNWRTLVRIACVFIVIVGAADSFSVSSAQDTTWTNATGDERWNNEDNWSSGVPRDVRDARFVDSGNCILESASNAVRAFTINSTSDMVFTHPSNGLLTVGLGRFSRIFGSASFCNQRVRMGGGHFHVTGALSLIEGTEWVGVEDLGVAHSSSPALLVVDGDGSRLRHLRIWVGYNDLAGAGGILINNGGMVSSDEIEIFPGSAVGIHGGKLGVGVCSLSTASRIVGSSGSVEGIIVTNGDIDFSTLADPFEDDLDWTTAVLRNRYHMTGAALVDTSFRNAFDGEVDVPASQPLHFLGDVENYGIIDQAENGTLQSDRFFRNKDGGLIVLRGQLISGQPIFNNGTLLFDGANTSVIGNFVNGSGGVVQTNANKRITFHDLFFNDGEPFETAINATTILAGLVYGHGHYTGDGRLIIAGDFIAGNDDIATIEIEPSSIVGNSAEILLEIEGPSSSEFDQLNFWNDVVLNGTVDVELRGIYQVQQGETFDLITGADIQLGSGFSIVPPNNHTVSHSIVDLGGGREALRIEFTSVPGFEIIAPETIQVTRGALVAGTLAELSTSDNADLSFERSRQSAQAVAQFVVGASISSPSPSELRLRVESSVFSRGDIDLKLEVFNVASGEYELLAMETGSRFSDSTFEHTFPGDPGDYINANSEVEARVTYSSTVNRRIFRANVDQVVWVVGD